MAELGQLQTFDDRHTAVIDTTLPYESIVLVQSLTK